MGVSSEYEAGAKTSCKGGVYHELVARPFQREINRQATN